MNTVLKDEDGSVTTFESEEQFFNHFGLPFIPPALRRNGSEIDRVEELTGTYYTSRYSFGFAYAHYVVGRGAFHS